MTSLRTFQNEIDEIQHREVTRQRTQAALERGKEKEKKPAGKLIEVQDRPETSVPSGGTNPESSDVDEEIQVNILTMDRHRLRPTDRHS